MRFKHRLVQANGQDIAPRRKGWVVHLGAYLSNDKPVEIVDVKKNAEGVETKASWDEKSRQIKVNVSKKVKRRFPLTDRDTSLR